MGIFSENSFLTHILDLVLKINTIIHHVKCNIIYVITTIYNFEIPGDQNVRVRKQKHCFQTLNHILYITSIYLVL